MTDRDVCAVHDIVVNRIDEKLSSVICKLDAYQDSIMNCVTELREHTVKIEHLQKSDNEQWQAIGEMRKVIYKAIGIAVGMMTVLQILFQLWDKH